MGSGTDNRWRERILLPLISILILLVVLEVGSLVLLKLLGPGRDPGVRFASEEVWKHLGNPFLEPDPELGWRPIPGYSRGAISIGPHGFRGPSVSLEKQPGIQRVALLGNSVSFGYLLPTEAGYAQKLADLLNEACLGGRVEVLNCGVPGYTSWQGRRLLNTRILDYRPDILIAMFGYNDHHSAVKSDRDVYRARHVRNLFERLRNTALFRAVHRLRNPGATRLPERPVSRVNLEEFRENTLAIQERAAQAGIRAFFTTIPIRGDRPLVENFRAIDFADGRVWMRQIDFVANSLPAEARPIIEGLFLGRESLSSVDLRPYCEAIVELNVQFPDLSIVHYLLAGCLRQAGQSAEAVRQLRESVRRDDERREMEAYNQVLRELGGEGKIQLIDLARQFEFEGSDSLFLDVVHPTPEGHAVIARAIAGRLCGQPIEDR